MYNKNRPATALNQVADVAMGNVGSDDIVRTELDSLDLTAAYNFEEASSDYSQYINNYNAKNWLWQMGGN